MLTRDVWLLLTGLFGFEVIFFSLIWNLVVFGLMSFTSYDAFGLVSYE